MTRPVSVHFPQTTSKSDKIKLCDIQEENDKLKSLTVDLREDLTTMNETLKQTLCVHSEIQDRLSEEQGKFMNFQTEYSNLQSKLYDEQCLHKEKEIELSEFKEQTYNMVDKEVEHHRYIKNYIFRK